MSEAATLEPGEAHGRRGQAAAPIGALRRGQPVRAAELVRLAAPILDRDAPPTPVPGSVLGRLQALIGLTLIVVALLMTALAEPVWHGPNSVMPPGMVRAIQSIPGFGPWFSSLLGRAQPAKASNRPSDMPPPTNLSPDELSADALLDLTPEQAREMNAAIPISKVKSGVAQPFSIPFEDLEVRHRAVQCLTAAVYYEAGQEPLVGQRGVAQVVLNRLRHPAYPKTVCGVIFQGSERRTGCQFTFTCDGSLARRPNPVLWRRAQSVAEAALNGWVERSVGLSTHYHANYVVPKWAHTLVKTQVLGAHIFYRWTGGWGMPAAFAGTWAGQEPLIPGLPAIEQAEAPEVVFATALFTTPTPVPAAVQRPSAVVALEKTAAEEELPPPPPPVVLTAPPPEPTPVLIAPAPGSRPEPKTPPKPGSRPRIAVPSNW